MAKVRIKALWIGPELKRIERISLLTFVAAGHQVDLFTYGPVANVPSEVTVRDGRDILPEDRILLHRRSGSPALFSDFFRYAVIACEGGVWVDTDMICLKPFDFDQDYVFGKQNDRLINCAVYSAPQGSALEGFLLDVGHRRPRLPLWATGRSLARIVVGSVLGKYRGIEDAPWGMYGPELLTAAVRRLKLRQFCADSTVFYPVGPEDASVFTDPAKDVSACFGSKTMAVHLWRHQLENMMDQPFPEGSFLRRLEREFL